MPPLDCSNKDKGESSFLRGEAHGNGWHNIVNNTQIDQLLYMPRSTPYIEF